MPVIERFNARPIKIQTNINPYADGSVIIECGNTKVHITAIIENSVPGWLKGQGKGWLSAEYNMLPGATHTRNQRDRKSVSGRTQEIQRLIGRSLRAAIDLNKIGERSITIDCDVLVADGGTRTTSITGAYVALALALKKHGLQGQLSNQIAAISVGINSTGNIIADLNYEEDSSCETDMNIVMTADQKFIELQGTAEGVAFSSEQLGLLTDAGQKCIEQIFEIQNKAIQEAK
jgi:ribonuclease PH